MGPEHIEKRLEFVCCEKTPRIEIYYRAHEKNEHEAAVQVPRRDLRLFEVNRGRR